MVLLNETGYTISGIVREGVKKSPAGLGLVMKQIAMSLLRCSLRRALLSSSK